MTLGLSSGFDVTQGVGTVSNPWIIKDHVILASETVSEGTYPIDLTGYIPNDGNDYEVLWMFSSIGSGNATIQTNGTNFGGILSGSGQNSRVNGVLPIDSSRNVSYRVYNTITDANLLFRAYRKTSNF